MKLSLIEKIILKLSNKKRLLVLGDSHTAIFDDGELKEELEKKYQVFIETVGGATISGLTNPNSKTNAHAIFSNSFKIIRPDILITQLGEVDTGFVIWYRAQKNHSTVAEMLELCVSNYEKFLHEYRGNIDTFVISAPLPTIRDRQNWGEVANLRKEVTATQKERTSLTLEFNTRMELKVQQLGMQYINLDQESMGTDGLVSQTLLNDDNNDHHYCKKAYVKLIMKHLRESSLEI